MTIYKGFGSRITSLILPLLVLSAFAPAQSKSNAFACKEANAAQLCNAANTCGSTSTSCGVDVKRTSSAASSTPDIPGAKSNSLFCVKAGTTVEWKSTGKDIGFVVDFGTASPFAPAGAIIGGSDRSRAVMAKTPGCYRYSAGACMSGAIYGMCGQTTAKLIIVP